MEKMTVELARQYLKTEHGGGRVALQQRLGFYPDHMSCQTACEYFLEGHESRQGEIGELRAELQKAKDLIILHTQNEARRRSYRI